MSDLSSTQFFQVEPGPQISAKDIFEIVYKALKEKGYRIVSFFFQSLVYDLKNILRRNLRTRLYLKELSTT